MYHEKSLVPCAESCDLSQDHDFTTTWGAGGGMSQEGRAGSWILRKHFATQYIIFAIDKAQRGMDY